MELVFSLDFDDDGDDANEAGRLMVS